MNIETWDILLVDDNSDDRSFVKSYLRQDEERRYKFYEAASGGEALAGCEKEGGWLPKVILLDYHLPDMDAAQFLRAIRGADELPPCPIVILTGSASAATARAALQGGAQDYVGKGWMTAQSLSRVIENACERWRMTRDMQLNRRRLEDSERFCRAIMESSPDSMKALNSEGVVLRANPAAVRRWGVPNEAALVGRVWADLWPEPYRHLAAEAIESAQQGRVYRFRSQTTSPSAGKRWWDSIVTPLRESADLQITGLLATSRDITEQKQAEDAACEARELAEADSKGKDRFLAMLSHELRNPLNPVRLTADEMLSLGSLDAESRSAWELVARNVAVQAALIDDLLDLSRITQGKLELRCHPIELHDVIHSALETSRSAADVKEVDVQLEFDAPYASISGDPVRLQQVFWNLLNNAIKFTPHRGWVRISVSNPRDTMIRVEVRDNGIGLSADEMRMVFDPFKQGDHVKGSTKANGGLGIGLTITRQLVEMHGGNVSVASEGKGKGAVFVVDLPLLPLTKAGSPAPNATRVVTRQEPPPIEVTPGQPRPKVLVVEDDEATRTVLSKLMEKRGYKVRTASCLSDARLAAADFECDLVLCDLGLPDGTGFELLNQLRQIRRRSLRGIALSGYGAREDIDASRTAGFAAHLVKPVDIQKLDAELLRLSADL